MHPPWTRIREELRFLYGRSGAEQAWEGVRALLERWTAGLRPPEGVDPRECLRGRLRGLDQAACLLITYGDQFREPGVAPLATLERALTLLFHDRLSGVHVLPFFPWSSDDGFSVKDFRAVDPRLGGWQDIQRLASRRLLMVDLVLNHASAQGTWFQSYLRGEPRYRDFFLEVPEGADLSGVFRPRALPLATGFRTASGPRRLWTTFGPDQVDLNWANPAVALEMLDVLLGYIARGAQLVRLDAVAYAWKEVGTPCLHHPRTHGLVRLLRAVLDAAAPWVLLITETNVPQAENLSYFGGGSEEAQLVYQFPLPPLVLDAFLRGQADTLRAWAAALPARGPDTAYFNFLASHDGVGLLPAAGLLPPERVRALADAVLERGGRVSYKSSPAGEVPYELNVSYLDAVAATNEPGSRRADAFLAAQAILLAMAGVPGIYAHSLLGTPGDREAVERTGQNRAINRRKLEYREAEALLEEPEGLEGPAGRPKEFAGPLRGLVLAGMGRLLRARAGHPAFHPQGAQRVLGGGEPEAQALFCLQRVSPDGRRKVLCLHNVSARPAAFRLPRGAPRAGWVDLVTGRPVRAAGQPVVPLAPFEVLWLAHPADALPPLPAPDPEAREQARLLRGLLQPLDPLPTALAPRGRLRRPARAVLFDLYGTLWASAAGELERRDPGAPAPRGLERMLERYGCALSPRELADGLEAAVRREHARLGAQGADFPEVRIERLWAGLLGLHEEARARAFAVEYEALVNPVWPMPGLRAALRALRDRGLALGVLSNAQFYTPLLFECFLGEAPRGLGFREELLLYSCELGLAKPSPRLFALARERLEGLGIAPDRVLMVGNDAGRDLAPAARAGFRTALFAGDARSLRGAERAAEADAVLTALAQLPALVAGRRIG